MQKKLHPKKLIEDRGYLKSVVLLNFDIFRSDTVKLIVIRVCLFWFLKVSFNVDTYNRKTTFDKKDILNMHGQISQIDYLVVNLQMRMSL